MYRYKTIVFYLNSVLMLDGIGELLDKLKEEGYVLIGYDDSGRNKGQDNQNLQNEKILEKFCDIKAVSKGLSKAQVIKQTLDEYQCSNAIIVSGDDRDFPAADETGCLSIEISCQYKKAGGDFLAHTPMEILPIITKINVLFPQITKAILGKKKRNRPLLVGVNGVDASGKSIFTKDLEKYLLKQGYPVQTIHMDDFHNPSHIRYKNPDPIMSYINHGFDLERLEKEILQPIASEGKLNKELLLLDLEKDTFSIKKDYKIHEHTIVLIEGVLLYREPLEKYIDYKIYMDISFEEVLKRVVKRDGYLFGDQTMEKYQEKYIPIQKQYIEKYDPVGLSHLVICNEDFLNPQIIKIEKERQHTPKDGIVLRPVVLEDLADIRKLHENHEVKEMLGVVELPDESYFHSKNCANYGIVDGNNRFIGIVELFNISWKNKRAELSIVISAEDRGKGYGQEAVKRILQIAFEELGLNRVWLRVLAHNHQGIACYKKVGFIQEGVCRDESLRGGIFRDQIQMSILKREWLNA